MHQKGYHILLFERTVYGGSWGEHILFSYQVPSERKGVWQRAAVSPQASKTPQAETNLYITLGTRE